MTDTAAPRWIPDRPSPAELRRWGLEPEWSRVVDVPSHDGSTYRWHVLDTAPDEPVATMLCVHGNPTWAYAWKRFLTGFGDRVRVLAVDQLGMGFSERTPLRRYPDRVRDLDDALRALDVDPDLPLFVAGHDWGGAVAMGWVVDHSDRVAGLVLANTGIAVPEGRSAPRIIRLAAWAPLLDFVCRGSRTFVDGALRMARGRLSKVDREAFRAPYHSAAARVAIADFVGDIPLHEGHPSEAPLEDVARRLPGISAPVLLLWGAKDPVFDDDFAQDLLGRLPTAELHRFPHASHLVTAEVDVAAVAEPWLDDVLRGRDDAGGWAAAPDAASVWSTLEARRGSDEVAFVDMATRTTIDFAALLARIDGVAAGLRRRGLRPGDRVAMLTPPGIDLVAAVYGVWRAGGVTVIADRGLGLGGLGAAVRSTRPDWVIGPRRALLAARGLRWAPGATHLEVGGLVGSDPGALPDPPPADHVAAVLFTSGATGPAKGVRYLHGQLAAQRDALAATYGIGRGDRLVAAFAPFALYGPALGIPTALPDCDVTTPGELTATALEDACSTIDATLAFASPAALANVVATAGERDRWPGLAGLRVVFSAGAPVPAETLRDVARLAPHATLHTPYGMTEALPVADIDLDGIDVAQSDESAGGVCVGRPVAGAEVRIAPLGFDAGAEPDALPVGALGEILVSAPWVSDGYVGAWGTQRAARPPGEVPWHRTGDVGHVDAQGRLWVEGRSVHVIHALGGPITPVPVERAVESALGVRRSAAVGVGPDGLQQLAVVVEDRHGGDGLAPEALAQQVRGVVDPPVAAVLTLRSIPVDIRHNAKVDRTAVARWADAVLAGRRARVPG